MKKFILKFILVVSLMFVSVLFGMEEATEGIHRMKGYEDEGFQNALSFGEKRDGNLEVSVMGDRISSHDLEKKKERLEETKAYNFFSSMGKKLADTLSNITEKAMQSIADILSNNDDEK